MHIHAHAHVWGEPQIPQSVSTTAGKGATDNFIIDKTSTREYTFYPYVRVLALAPDDQDSQELQVCAGFAFGFGVWVWRLAEVVRRRLSEFSAQGLASIVRTCRLPFELGAGPITNGVS